MQERLIKFVSLNLLKHSGKNVRKADAGEVSLKELKASIVAHGILQNLTVREASSGVRAG